MYPQGGVCITYMDTTDSYNGQRKLDSRLPTRPCTAPNRESPLPRTCTPNGCVFRWGWWWCAPLPPHVEVRQRENDRPLPRSASRATSEGTWPPRTLAAARPEPRAPHASCHCRPFPVGRQRPTTPAGPRHAPVGGRGVPPSTSADRRAPPAALVLTLPAAGAVGRPWLRPSLPRYLPPTPRPNYRPRPPATPPSRPAVARRMRGRAAPPLPPLRSPPTPPLVSLVGRRASTARHTARAAAGGRRRPPPWPPRWGGGGGWPAACPATPGRPGPCPPTATTTTTLLHHD